MKALALFLALVFFVLGILYATGTLQLFTHEASPHHWKHTIVLWILALLCLIWARFQRAPRAI